MVSLLPATSAEVRMAGFQQKMQLMDESLVSNVAFRNIGAYRDEWAYR